VTLTTTTAAKWKILCKT